MDDYNNSGCVTPEENINVPAAVEAAAPVVDEAPPVAETVAEVANEIPATATVVVSVAGNGIPVESTAEVKKPKKEKTASHLASVIMIIIVISAGLAALCYGTISGVIDSRGYSAALDNFMQVVMNENVDGMESIMPAEAWEYVAAEEDMDKQELIDSLKSDIEDNGEAIDEMENFQYGILSSGKVDDNTCSKIGDMLNENYGMSADCVEEAYKIEFQYTYEYDDEDYDETEEAYAVKINGQWYLVNTDGRFGDFMD